jgi:hypothetical protein
MQSCIAPRQRKNLMSTLPSGKYQLKSLHEEIALFDRKLAHTHKYEAFPTEDGRTAALDKLSAKRNLLIRKAQQMIDEGIEFSDLERPESLRTKKDSASVEAPVVAQIDATTQEIALAPAVQPSPYAGTSLDYQAEIESYKTNKAKRKTA